MKYIRLSFLFLFLGLASAGAFAQGRIIPCTTDEYYKEQTGKFPEVLALENSMRFKSNSSQRGSDDTVTYTIPVVFHIIHNGGAEIILKLRVDQQIITLNETYNKQNRDTQSIRSVFKPLASPVKIKFILATHDPNGACTDGIDRIQSTLTTNATDQVKSLAQWDPKKYLNIWVVSSIKNFTGAQGTIAGYATFPWLAASQPKLDGIVVDYHYVGRSYKVLTHEIGHYLGLYHTFQDGCSGGDDVDDTPPVSAANFGWNTTINTCSSDMPDMPDMIENYMDYADYSYMFTKDQVERMRHYLSLYRSTLISSSNINYVTAPCLTTSMTETPGTIAGITAYPNPTNNITNLYLPATLSGNLLLSIYGPEGKLVYKETIEAKGMEQVRTLNLEEIGNKGIYFLVLTGNQGMKTMKILVQ